MTTLPLAVLLIPFAILLFLFLFFAFVDLYHLIVFGRATGIVGFIATFIFIAVTILIVNTSYLYVINIDWTRPVEITQFIPNFTAPEFGE